MLLQHTKSNAIDVTGALPYALFANEALHKYSSSVLTENNSTH